MTEVRIQGIDWPNQTSGRDYGAPSQYVFDIHLRIELDGAHVLKSIDDAYGEAKRNGDRSLTALKNLLRGQLQNRNRANFANLGLVDAMQTPEE